MKVSNIIRPYKIQGEKVVVGEERKMLVKSVWNSGEMVEVSMTQKDGPSIDFVVRGVELVKAIENALNRPFDGRE